MKLLLEKNSSPFFHIQKTSTDFLFFSYSVKTLLNNLLFKDQQRPLSVQVVIIRCFLLFLGV